MSEVHESAEDLAHAEREAMENFAKAATECCGAWGEQCRSLGEAATKFVRDKPLQSLAIAAGVGLLVGLVVRRK